MSAAGAAPSLTRRDLETALIEKCWKDPEFKKQIVSDPKGMLERHIAQKLPADLKIFIHEEDANTCIFLCRPRPPTQWNFPMKIWKKSRAELRFLGDR